MLWICGPAGVGKSTASWQLYTELAGSGIHVALADSDQLCMCYPAPAGDPGRLRASAGEVERRLTARDGRRDARDGLLRQVRDEIRLLDESGFADAWVDTTGIPAGRTPPVWPSTRPASPPTSRPA